jgi:flagellar motor switch protein FliN
MARRTRRLPKLAPGGIAGAPLLGLGDLADLAVRLEVPLGTVEVDVRELLDLDVGSVLRLDRLTGEPLVVVANGTPIADGEVRLHGERLAIRITQIRGAAGGDAPHGAPRDGDPREG